MHFTPEESGLLKTWVTRKLEHISDADADVLADYALALVSTEDGEAVARLNCVENLKDFLPNNAELFVNELFEAIKTKSYDPSRPKVKAVPSKPQLPAAPRKDGPEHMHQSRKRSYQWDGDEAVGQNGNSVVGSRPVKQMRRGGRGRIERGGRQPGAPRTPFAPQQFTPAQQTLNPQALPSGLPQLDLNDPMTMMVMQQFMATLAGFQNSASPSNSMPFKPPGSGQRCRNYEEHGFCAAGHSCPFEHSNAQFLPTPQSLEYDPANATLSGAPTTNGAFSESSPRARAGMRGRARGKNNFRGGGQRSDFSSLGPDRDSTNTSIVVEQIPQDKLNEDAVREFFSAFGAIEEVSMHPDRKLAIVRYDSKAGARAAYESPRVVFDNRFVKVYWYNASRFEQQRGEVPMTDHGTALDTDMQDNEQGDPAGIAHRQEEAQRKHEEAQKQREEMERQKASINEKLKVMDAERRKMAALLAKKSGKASSSTTGSPVPDGEGEDSEQTKALRAQLAKLEAEAKELGIDPTSPPMNGYEDFTPSYRGRGGYRGRGRGRGYRQSYRGRWAGAAGRGGGVMRLDHRPKTVAVGFTNEKSYDANDEALRQFLLFNSMDAAAVAQHPEKSDTALVTFHQRYEGENFLLAAGAQIPHTGKVEVSWYSGTPPVSVKAQTNGSHENGFTEFKIERDGSEVDEREMFDTEDREREEQDLDRFA